MVYTSRLELWSGAPVIARDGPVGTVKHMFLHIRHRCIVALVVQRYQPFTRPVIVPVTRITSASNQAIHLDISRSEVDVLPPYSVRLYRSASSRQRAGLNHASSLMTGRGATPSQSPILAAHMHMHQHTRYADIFLNYALIHARQKVFCPKGCAGRLAGFLVASNGQVQSLILRVIRPWPHMVCLPIAQLDRIDRNGLHLSVPRCKLHILPPYRPDSALKVVVADTLDQATWHGDRHHPCIDVAVHAGVVYLSGYVDKREQRAYAEQVVRSVKGIAGVVNELVVDGEVVYAVAECLARHAWMAANPVSVYAHQGVVYLDGSVADMAMRAAAEECAAQVPVVRGVINRIRVAGRNWPIREDQRVLQPQIGQDVFATDQLIGSVERVIINHHNRRVIACVVCVRHLHLAPDEHRHIVIPTGAIRDVTPGGVLLGIASQALVAFPLFDREDYLLPPLDWQPPYPYQPAAVLWAHDDAYYSTGSMYQGKPAIGSPPRTRRRGISYKLPI